jgi:hypothetical protein
VRRSADEDPNNPNPGDDILVFREVAAALAKIPVIKLRAEVGLLTWKAKLGPFDEGSQGYGGPFRQSLSALSTYIRRAAMQRKGTGGDGAAAPAAAAADSKSAAGRAGGSSSELQPLFIQCPNGVHQVGSDRDKLVVNPACTSPQDLQCYYAFGQLMGVAIRSKTSLDLDLAAVFWQLLLDVRRTRCTAIAQHALPSRRFNSSVGFNSSESNTCAPSRVSCRC